MFFSTSARLALCSPSLLLAAQRLVSTPTPGVVLDTAEPARFIDATAPRPHTRVFSSLKGSLDNLLGEASVGTVQVEATPEEVMQQQAIKFPQSKEASSAESVEWLPMPSYYKPMDLNEVLYEGDIAECLCAAAGSRGFRSPVWGTRLAVERSGFSIRDGETGVDVCIATGAITLYNFEQTNAPDAVSCTSLKNKNVAMQSLDLPLSASGRPHSWRVQCILKNHPFYSRYTSPYWVSEKEAVALGTEVPPAQRECGIVIPSQPPVTDAKEEIAKDGQLSPTSEISTLYNAEQLENPQMVTSKTCPLVECVNIYGRSYSTLFTVYMRQYCRQHNLRTKPLAVFVTAARVRALGGELLSVGDTLPSLSFLMGADIVSLHHADRTTIAEKLIHIAMTRKQDWLRQKRGREM